MRSSLTLALASILFSCTGGPGAAVDSGSDRDAVGDGADAGGSTDGNGQPACSFTTAAAQFALADYGGHVGLSGAYQDRPNPQIMVEKERVGDCAFFSPAASFCDPACIDGICAVGGECVPYPQYLAAGTLTLTGTDPALVIEQQEGGYYYTTETYTTDLYRPGDELTLSGPGAGEVAPFEVAVHAVPSIEVSSEEFRAVEHQAMVITWDTAASSPDGSRVVVRMDVDHHAGLAHVECVTEDTGSVTVDSSVLDALIEAGVNGIGTYIESAYIVRVNRGAVETSSGCVGFESKSLVPLRVETILASGN